VTLLTADALVRTQLYGFSKARIACFTTALFATAFSHYFASGTLIALLIYALWKMPAHRKAIMWAFIVVGLVFAVAWGPFMWQQRHLFSTDDPATTFLVSDDPLHARVTALRFLMAPALLLSPLDGVPAAVVAAIGTAVYLAPLLLLRFRKAPSILLWELWLIATIAVVCGLDFTRRTNHLYFIRYTILAGPAVYALIPLVSRFFGIWPCNLAGSIAVLACLLKLPAVYSPNPADPRRIVSDFVIMPTSKDLLIVAAAPQRCPMRRWKFFDSLDLSIR
jgi:hypothetical protein